MDLSHKAIDLILERGVRFRLPAPLLLRCLGVRTLPLTIRPLYLGTILEIVRLADKGDRAEVQAEILALAVLNDHSRIRLFRRRLTRYLLHHVRSDSLLELFGVVLEMTRQADFMRITIWAAQLAEIAKPSQSVRGS